MTPNPILKVLFTLNQHHVKSLLIGGQACIIYGAAEFSRDSDFAVLATPANIKHLRAAMKELKAELIYVPPLEVEYLERGHGCHFRCQAKGVENLRVDIMAKLKGCEPFDKLWARKNTVKLKDGLVNVISLYDLVQSKKTQRDKDWLMLKRLINNDIIQKNYSASKVHVSWWLEECRDADVLLELVKKYPDPAKESVKRRPLLGLVIDFDRDKLLKQIHEEEILERQKDIKYWEPLRRELEILRHGSCNN